MREKTVNFLIERFERQTFDSLFFLTLIELLETCLNDDELTASFHPLGFIIIPLKDWYEGKRFRLHIWPPDHRRYNDNRAWVHSHEYDVDSLIISGRIINYSFNSSEDSKKCLYPIYQVVYTATNSDLVATGRFCDVELVKKEILSFGDFYSIKKWSYHKVDVEEDHIASTLVLNYNKEATTAFVIGSATTSQTVFPYKRDVYDVENLKALIKALISHLQKEIA